MYADLCARTRALSRSQYQTNGRHIRYADDVAAIVQRWEDHKLQVAAASTVAANITESAGRKAEIARLTAEWKASKQNKEWIKAKEIRIGLDAVRAWHATANGTHKCKLHPTLPRPDAKHHKPLN